MFFQFCGALVDFLLLAAGQKKLIFVVAQNLTGAPQRIQPQADFQRPLFLGEFQILFGLFRLLAQGADPGFELGENIVQTHQIFLRLLQPPFRFALSVTKTGNPRGFFKNFAPVFAAGGNDAVDLALPDHRIAVAPHAGIHKQLVNIAQAHGVFVEQVLAIPRTVVPAGNGDLIAVKLQLAVGVVKGKGDLRIALRLARRGSAENHVLHFRAAEHTGRLLTQHPADGVADVAFSAAVRPHHGGDAAVKL